MKILASNRQARHNYEIKQSFEAGIVLSGSEVKSVKAGHIDLKGSYVTVKAGEVFIINMHVNPYKFGAQGENYDPNQQRKLLLHKKEIAALVLNAQSQQLSIVPVRVGLVRGKVKIEIALARGKRQYDKREAKKRKTMLRDAKLESNK